MDDLRSHGLNKLYALLMNPLKLEDGKRLSLDSYEDRGDSRLEQASPAVDNNFMGNSKVLLDWSPEFTTITKPTFPVAHGEIKVDQSAWSCTHLYVLLFLCTQGS